MRFVACIFLIAAAVPGRADLYDSSDVTVIFDFRGPHPGGTTEAMEREANLIMKPAGVNLAWRPIAGASSSTYNNLVVITFRGSCEVDRDAPRNDKPGPYAMTWISDGDVLPFGEVDCKRVVNAVRFSCGSDSTFVAQQLVGRALGRILSHELVHMLTRSEEHGRDGILMPSLSGRQLTAASLRLDPEDILRLRQALRHR